MNKDEIQSLIVKVLIMVLTSIATAMHMTPDASSIATAAVDIGSLGMLAFAVYQHWNMKKVPETSIVLPAPPSVGGRPDGANRGGLMGLAILAAIGFGVAEMDIGLARAEDPTAFNLHTHPAGAASTATNAGGALGGAMGDVITFFSTDFDNAATLATEIPGLQDNNGKACWMRASSIGTLLKAHPLPLTLKAATDLEALRLFSMAINQMCADPACTQVFTDLSNGIAQIGVGIPIPSLTSLCAKVPTITPGPVVAVTPAAPAAN
jgi:hypothetical protein